LFLPSGKESANKKQREEILIFFRRAGTFFFANLKGHCMIIFHFFSKMTKLILQTSNKETVLWLSKLGLMDLGE
jgi:hypothetical protein